MSRAAAAGLGLVAAGLLGLLVMEYRLLQSPPPMENMRAPGGAPMAVPAPAPPDRTLSDVATILARPLFRADRRPPATPGAAAGRASDLPRLTAILIDGQGRRAIFAAPPVGGGRPIVAAEGARVGVWLVQAIRPGEVTVYGPEGPRSLRPSYDLSVPEPTASGSAAAGLATTLTPTSPPPAGASILDLLLRRGTPDIGVPGLPNAPAPRESPPQESPPRGPPIQGVPP